MNIYKDKHVFYEPPQYTYVYARFMLMNSPRNNFLHLLSYEYWKFIV